MQENRHPALKLRFKTRDLPPRLKQDLESRRGGKRIVPGNEAEEGEKGIHRVTHATGEAQAGNECQQGKPLGGSTLSEILRGG